MSPEKTLKSILGIISRDVRLIKKTKTRLPPEDALTLSRYASTLNSIVDDEKKKKDRARRQLEQLPTDELVQVYLEGRKKKEEMKK